MADFLIDLLRAHGMSGQEGPVRELIKQQMKSLSKKVRTDNLGNLVATIGSGHPHIMLAAHMDEIGLMVKRIDKHGFIYFSSVGGIDPISLVDQEVHVVTDRGHLRGVITMADIDAGGTVTKLPKMEQLFVDTGLTGKELERFDVEIGTALNLVACPNRVENDVIFGKALDDRLGCYILVELARRLQKKTPCQIDFVFTVQEEVGLYGAETAAFSLSPDFGIAVDVIHANDALPEPSRQLGDGPALLIKDYEMLSDPRINSWITSIARRRSIPLQRAVIDTGTTDATRIFSSKSGVPSAVVSVLIRNIHTTHSLARMSDVQHAIDLLEAVVRNPPKLKPQ